MNKFENENDLMDSIDTQTMINDISEIMLHEIKTLNDNEKLIFIKDILWAMNRSTLKGYFDDFGCLEAYCERLTDSIEYRKAAT